MSPPPGLEGVPLSPALASARSPAAPHYRDTLGSDKDRDTSQGDKEKETWGATGVQAGGPVRTRVRKTSRANLFVGKHGPHAAGVRTSTSIPVHQEPAAPLPGKVAQPGPYPQEAAPGGAASPAQEDPQPSSSVPETSASASPAQDGLSGEAEEVYSHMNHNTSAAEDGDPTSAGTPC